MSTSCSWIRSRRRSRSCPSWDFGPARGDDPCGARRPSRGPSMLDDAAAMPKCVFTREHFHWHDDRPPRHPWSKMVIYETHVRGFTDSSQLGRAAVPAPTVG